MYIPPLLLVIPEFAADFCEENEQLFDAICLKEENEINDIINDLFDLYGDCNSRYNYRINYGFGYGDGDIYGYGLGYGFASGKGMSWYGMGTVACYGHGFACGTEEMQI